MQAASQSRQTIFFLAGFLLLSLAVRLLLINWYSAPYSDGVFLMTLFETYNFNNSYPPLYSTLLYGVNYLLHDPILSGRLVSIVSGVGVVLLVYHFGRRFFNEKTGMLAALIYGTAPITFRWDIRVMSDSLFVLFFTGALFFLMSGLSKRSNQYDFLYFNLAAGLSALTRYQGLVFVPISAIWLYFSFVKKTERVGIAQVLLSLLLWLALPAWMLYRGFDHAKHYADFLTDSGSALLTLGRFLTLMDLFIPALIYVFGFLSFALAVYGGYKYLKNRLGSTMFLWVYAYLFTAFWIAHSAFLVAFQTRYFMPFWPFATVLTALGIFHLHEQRPHLAKAALSFILVSNIFWSGLILHFQRDSFGSLKRSAEFIADKYSGAFVASDELYKIAYFSSRVTPGKPFSRRFRLVSTDDSRLLPSGALVYISSLYRDDFVEQYNKHKDQLVYLDHEYIVPILPDVGRRKLINKPEWLASRFRPWKVYSAIYRVK